MGRGTAAAPSTASTRRPGLAAPATAATASAWTAKPAQVSRAGGREPLGKGPGSLQESWRSGKCLPVPPLLLLRVLMNAVLWRSLGAAPACLALGARWDESLTRGGSGDDTGTSLLPWLCLTVGSPSITGLTLFPFPSQLVAGSSSTTAPKCFVHKLHFVSRSLLCCHQICSVMRSHFCLWEVSLGR